MNLKKATIVNQKISKDSIYYLYGARGLTSHLVYDEVPPDCDPLGEDNKLIISNGLLTGSSFPCSGRASVGAKSPLTNGIKEANVGGRPSMMLALHGIRALVFEGISPRLKLLVIEDDNIRLEEAQEYARIGNYELSEKLYEVYGKKIGIFSIGPAGELTMKSASVAANDLEGYPSRHAARGGLGAVMGSKKLKAVVIIPTRKSKISIVDRNKFKAIVKPFAKELAESKEWFSIYGTPNLTQGMNIYGGLPTENFKRGSYEDVEKISGEKLHELIVSRNGKNRLPCSPTCVIKCSNQVMDSNGNFVTASMEYETIALNGSNLLINDLDALALINRYCDDIGVDTIEFGGTIGVAMDCNQLKWGDSTTVLKILNEEIRNGTEVGFLYGNGVKHIGITLHAKRVPHVKGQGLSAYDPRVFKAMGITYATSPMGADHTSGPAIVGRKAHLDKEYGEYNEDNNKLELSYELQICIAILDSMGCCYFIGVNFEMIELLTNALNAMYGLNLSADEVVIIGKEILKMELKFNEKAGIPRDQNMLPKFFREESSEPLNLRVSISKDELNNFWNRLG
ncbi:MAG: aldehyde ferredoxin oxidoreductase [Candidatus Lokiarchaeota archaeon]|nr:aldehyde ferredoxin oxidoreductase [Candidatus Lokiarchaeota archaeon]